MTKRILVVEHEEQMRELCRRKLEQGGYQVFTAETGKMALKKMAEEPVQVVVLDLALPDGSGLEYMEQILKIDRTVKVIIHTENPIFKWDFRSWAADAFLIKQADLTDLQSTIDTVLNFELKNAGENGGRKQGSSDDLKDHLYR